MKKQHHPEIFKDYAEKPEKNRRRESKFVMA
jgi:hypothetical protein